jgi:uncharacterized protein YhaN
MSEIDLLSETEAETGEAENEKLVPVGESIRYRKRAQSAERKLEQLGEQLAQANSQAAALSEQLDEIRSEQELTRKLTAAGAADLEAAVALAKVRMRNKPDTDVDGIVEQLKREKQYLFADVGKTVSSTKTAGAKERTASPQAVLAKAAKKACATGNRTDLQEYLRLRRNFL